MSMIITWFVVDISNVTIKDMIYNLELFYSFLEIF